jgi:hypothetical protein
MSKTTGTERKAIVTIQARVFVIGTMAEDAAGEEDHSADVPMKTNAIFAQAIPTGQVTTKHTG